MDESKFLVGTADPDYYPGGRIAKQKYGCACEGIANRWGEGRPVKNSPDIVEFTIDPSCQFHNQILEEPNGNSDSSIST